MKMRANTDKSRHHVDARNLCHEMEFNGLPTQQ